MKISRYGSRQFQNGNKGTSERSAVFRKRYKVDQIIQGILLKWESSRLGWVEIGDQQLLANIMTAPSPGDTLTFVVQQLFPDIILKEINPDHLNAHGTYINPADVTRQFVTCRAAFQSQARKILCEFGKLNKSKASERLSLFLTALESDKKSAEMFFETLSCVADLNSIFSKAKLFYMPWLVPVALNQEIVLKIRADKDNPDNSFYELLYSLDLPPSVPARFKILYKKPQCGFKLLADDQNLKTLLGVHLKHSFSEFLSVERIPPQNSGGFLSELLASS